jgi:glutathione S-transferase
MILMGQYDSPFVRRVGIALTLYGIPFEQDPLSAWGDAERLRQINPLTRVPTLILDDGTVLVDSVTMLDWLDEQVGPERAMVPASGAARREQLKTTALATGLGDKAVSLFYEGRLHETVSEKWVSRCRAQIGAVLAALEADRAARKTPFWFGDRISHADIAVACVLRFIADGLPGVVPMGSYPALKAHWDRHEAMPVFKAVSQEFIAPA